MGGPGVVSGSNCRWSPYWEPRTALGSRQRGEAEGRTLMRLAGAGTSVQISTERALGYVLFPPQMPKGDMPGH